ncbi:hypothetical protein THAOC_09656 [Thalassiosira oceanica]|uniref:Uncharacterized protein n=1 Tax=Thalassiosira oceanica TaxID=159749 RepID=K0SS33_THAOC|nr:hypothetical protein THAOC_09656 [Thalassiosira oceanica]|eukprot:EJK69123.1 hypothetical protein THAOC_09656 [Thalassiosira oceanica]
MVKTTKPSCRNWLGMLDLVNKAEIMSLFKLRFLLGDPLRAGPSLLPPRRRTFLDRLILNHGCTLDDGANERLVSGVGALFLLLKKDGLGKKTYSVLEAASLPFTVLSRDASPIQSNPKQSKASKVVAGCSRELNEMETLRHQRRGIGILIGYQVWVMRTVLAVIDKQINFGGQIAFT